MLFVLGSETRVKFVKDRFVNYLDGDESRLIRLEKSLRCSNNMRSEFELVREEHTLV